MAHSAQSNAQDRNMSGRERKFQTSSSGRIKSGQGFGQLVEVKGHLFSVLPGNP